MAVLARCYANQRCLSYILLTLLFLVDSEAVAPEDSPSPINSVDDGFMVCAYHESDSPNVKMDSNQDEVLENGTLIRCGDPKDVCFAFWQQNTTHPQVNVIKGCFKEATMCNPDECISQVTTNLKDEVKNHFCCCSTTMCNLNLTVGKLRERKPVPEERKKNSMEDNVKLYIVRSMIGMSLVAVTLCALLLFYRKMRKRSEKNTSSMPNLPEHDSPSTPIIDLNSVCYAGKIGSGKFGTAYRATVDDVEVAVKLFSQQNRSSFTNEKYIYSLPLMSHENLLSYLGGGDMIGPDGKNYYGLVLSYCPGGRLSTYLQERTINWSTFCKMIVTMTRGLAHLHSDIRKGDLSKPCISHRDFNTRNILLNADMSCVVADLGFAIHTQGSKYYVNGEEQIAETSSLTDVGTLRYMAPEVLEGAVNLRDCEASLKQIDIYALGLVLWEVAYRCHDLYQGLQTPDYNLPYQEDIGLHASFEDMQVLVARKKARPLFPTVWKDTNPAMRQLKETIEDCWDHDAEARLSAMCVEGRLTELPTLWERHRSSLGMNCVSPTMNGTSSVLNRTVENGGILISNVLNSPKERPHTSGQEHSSSSATVETLVTMSPSGERSAPVHEVLCKNKMDENYQPPLKPIQPHQGRNPCIDRNLIRDIPQEPSISGNTLVQHNAPTVMPLSTANIMQALESHPALDAQDTQLLMNEHLIPLLNGYILQPTQPTVSPPVNNRPEPSPNPPIPYLQNEVHVIDAMPKKQNICANIPEHTSSWHKFKSSFGSKFGSIFPRRKRGALIDEERQEILISPTNSCHSELPTPLGSSNSYLAPPSNLDVIPQRTEIISNRDNTQTIVSLSESEFPSDSGYIAETEIGVGKSQNGFLPIIKSHQGSKDSGLNKSSESSLSFAEGEGSSEKLQRPNTLQLCDKVRNQNLNQNPQNLVDKNPLANNNECTIIESSLPNISISKSEKSDQQPSVKLRNPRNRIKTPRKPVNPRLSLYDDRIMGPTLVACGETSKDNLDNNSLSNSLPLDIENLEDNSQKSNKSCSQYPDKSESYTNNSQMLYPSLPRRAKRNSPAQV